MGKQAIGRIAKAVTCSSGNSSKNAELESEIRQLRENTINKEDLNKFIEAVKVREAALSSLIQTEKSVNELLRNDVGELQEEKDKLIRENEDLKHQIKTTTESFEKKAREFANTVVSLQTYIAEKNVR